MKRVRISNSSLNSYGTRVLTSGVDIEQYARNPIVLYMHERGTVIGQMRDIRKEGDDITGELVFDEATELSQRCKKQFEVGSLRMVSAGLDIVEWSEDPAYLVPGQTRYTVTKSKLFEVSVVDVGANDDAIVLHHQGKVLTLGCDGENPLPIISKKSKTEDRMEKSQLALALGLASDATEVQINETIIRLKASGERVEQLQKQYDELVLMGITQAVDGAIAEKRITAEQKEHFITLGKQVGLASLQTTIAAMSPRVKLTEMLNKQNSPSGGDTSGYKKLSDVPESELMQLRSENREQYIRLFKAEYGFNPQF